MRQLLKSGADAGASQGDGMTALHWAAMQGDGAMAEMLLVAGANARATTRIGGFTAAPPGQPGRPGRGRAGAHQGRRAGRRRARPPGATALMLAAGGRQRRHRVGARRRRRRPEPHRNRARTDRADVRRVARPHRGRQGAAGRAAPTATVRSRVVDLTQGRGARRGAAGSAAPAVVAAQPQRRQRGAPVRRRRRAGRRRACRVAGVDAALQVQRTHRQARRPDGPALRRSSGRDRDGAARWSRPAPT